MKNFISKFKWFILGGILTFAGVVGAIQISVPSGNGAGFLLQSLGSGNYGTVSLTAGSNVTISTTTTNITISASSGGGSGSGTVSTTTPLVAGQVDFSTGVSTIGNDSSFLFDNVAKRLSFNYSSSTIYSSFVIASTTNLIINGQSFNNLLGTGLSLVSGALTNNGVISLGNGTGTTCSGTNPGTCNVNTSQNIATLSNLTSNGLIYTAGSNGTLNITASSSIFGFTPASNATTITVAGTANQITSSAGAQDLSANRVWTLSFPNQVVFPQYASTTNGFSTPYSSSTETHVGTGQGFNYVGSNGLLGAISSSTAKLSWFTNDLANLTAGDSSLTLSAYNGSVARTIVLNTANTNTFSALQNFNYSSSTIYSSFFTSSSTNLFAGTLNLPNITGTQCLHEISGVVSGTGSDCGSGGGGEVNTASNLGTGKNIFDSKSGVDLRFNSLFAGVGLNLSTSTNSNTLALTTDHDSYSTVLAMNKGQFETLGQNWTSLGTQSAQTDAYAVFSMGDGRGMVVGNKILTTRDDGYTWTSQNQPIGGETGALGGIYLGRGIVLIGTYFNGHIGRSTNYGQTWTDIGAMGTSTHIYSFATEGNGIVLAATAKNSYIYRSTDYGATWTQQQWIACTATGTTGGGAKNVEYVGNHAFIVVCANAPAATQAFRSTDDGKTWTLSTTLTFGTEQDIDVVRSLGNGVVLFGTYPNSNIYRSTDFGITDSLSTTTSYLASSTIYMENIGNGVALAGVGLWSRSIMKTIDYGQTWTNLGRDGGGNIAFDGTNHFTWDIEGYLGNGTIITASVPDSSAAITLYRSSDESDVGFSNFAYSTSTIYSSFAIASTTSLIINGQSFNNLLGSGLVNTSNALTCATANTTTFGCLTSTDWNTFNNKIGNYDAWTHSTIFLPTSATTSKIAIGTTTPYYSLTVASTTGPQLALSDGVGGDASHTLRSTGGNFYIATSSVAGTATSTLSAVTLLSSGFFGIATNTPGSLFSIGNTGGINFVTGTSTFGSSENGINLTNGCFAIGGVCISGSAGGTTNPAGTGSELQYRLNGTTFGAVPLTAITLTGTSAFVGHGTTTPHFLLDLSSTTESQLGLGDGFNSHWVFRNSGGNLYIGTANATTYATGTPAITWLGTGQEGLNGTSSPFASLSINAASQTIPYQIIGSSTAEAMGIYPVSGVTFNGNESFALGTGTDALPVGWAYASINPNNIGSGNPEFVIGSSSATHLVVDGGGNIGISDATPDFKLESVGSFNLGYLGISNTGEGDIFKIDTTGKFSIGTSTTTVSPGKLVIASTTNPQITLHGNPGEPPVSLRSIGGAFYISTSSATAIATTTLPVIGFGSNGQIILGDYPNCNGATNALGVTSNIIGCDSGVSDIRLKKDISLLPDGLDMILKLKPVTFNWKDLTNHNTSDPREQVGFIAQDILPLIPTAVEKSPDGFYTLDKTRIIPYLVKAVQQLAEEKGMVRSVEENWQDILIGLLIVGFIYQQFQIKKLKK